MNKKENLYKKMAMLLFVALLLISTLMVYLSFNIPNLLKFEKMEHLLFVFTTGMSLYVTIHAFFAIEKQKYRKPSSFILLMSFSFVTLFSVVINSVEFVWIVVLFFLFFELISYILVELGYMKYFDNLVRWVYLKMR